ncbi:MAG: hypothetical protein ABIV13_03035, partial [Fimbriimonadales bacterium]
MRIISKFHDYYDSAMGYGQDPALIYNRVTEEVNVTSWLWDRRIIDLLECRTHYVRPVALAFCGKIYPIWPDQLTKLDHEFLSNDSSRDCTLAVEGLVKQAQTALAGHKRFWQVRRDFDKHIDSESRSVSYAHKKSQQFRATNIDDRIFRDLNCPSFVVLDVRTWRHTRTFSGRIVKNPRLATLGFQKEMDAFTAFQEIAMFLGSNLAAEPIAPDTVGDDELIARSKGFDEQSFRTAAPGQKKLNRKQNRQA